jgi:hypothetical protein
MKTKKYSNITIEDSSQFALTLEKNFKGIRAIEYDRTIKKLTIYYEEDVTEITEDELKTLKIPTVLRFRKKVTPPKLDAATVVSATENEFIVETFDTQALRKEVKEKLIEFEEVKK